MRINHNIAALNTYRQLGANSANGQKSLEKLSSGLRINKAGDDAAGLAISEKMRSQIRGLDQAGRNAQDGISLIQTAEGGLSETHSILQRMKELATQSASGTNTTSDRAEIQKEVNQLSSEINRIGNTTEFNTQKLLNGGTAVDASVTAAAAKLGGGLDAGTAATQADGTETSLGEDAVLGVLVSGDITLGGNGDTDTITVGDLTINITWDNTSGAFAAVDDISAANGVAGTVSLAIDVTQDEANAGTAIAAAFQAIIDEGDYDGTLVGATFAVNGDGLKVTMDSDIAEATANALKFVATADTAFAVAQDDETLSAEVVALVAGAVLDNDAVAASGNIKFDAVANAGVPSEGSSITLANNTIAFYDSSSGNFDDAAHAKSSLSADYVVDINGLTDGAGVAQAVVAAINDSPISGYTIAVDGTNTDQVNVTATSVGVSGLSVGQLVDETVASLTAASGSITFTSRPTEDSVVTIGDSKIGFYDSTSGNYADSAAAKTALGADYAIDINGKTTVNQIRDAVLALDPQMTEVTMTNGGVGKIDIAATTSGAAGNQIATSATNDDTKGYSAKLQIGANYAQSMTINITDMRSRALSITGDGISTTKTANDGAVASYAAVANVTNGTTNTSVEYSLDVSTHEKATAAISVLDDAITAVSAERSKIGAFQNRLEHTIAQLSTTSENVSAAESRVRDVDMAKEMMEFTKNNILSQAAQAMLAQANQQPQGVLQLLR